METEVSGIELMRKNGYSFTEIAKQIKRSKKYAWTHGKHIRLSKKGRRRYFNQVSGVTKPIKTQSTKLSKAKVRIIGHLLFDGTVFLTQYHYTAKYVNSSKDLIDRFIRDIKQVYGLAPSAIEVKKGKRTTYYKVAYLSNKMYNDLLKYTKSYSTSNKTATIPLNLLKGPKNLRLEFLRTFWEDEGSISKTCRLTGDLKSKRIILQLSELHRQFGLIHKICEYNTYTGPMYKLYLLKNKENLINFYKLGLFKDGMVTRGKYIGKKKVDVLKNFVKKYT